MKTIHYLAGILLLLTGILHIVMFVQQHEDPDVTGILIFGIIYTVIGLLLFTKKIYPLYLGLIVPVIGMTLSIIKFGLPELLSMLALFKVIGLIAVILCGYLILKTRQTSVSHNL